MSQQLEMAKEVIKQNIDSGSLGIYNTRNDSGDHMFSLYEEDGLEINICYYYEYFEVIGLSDEEFNELTEYYESLFIKGEKEDV